MANRPDSSSNNGLFEDEQPYGWGAGRARIIKPGKIKSCDARFFLTIGLLFQSKTQNRHRKHKKLPAGYWLQAGFLLCLRP